MSVSLPAKIDAISLEKFLALPETKPAREYINGNIHQKPMPKGKHSILQGRLGETINQIAASQKIAYSFPELRCSFGVRSIVPDIVVFEWKNLPLDDRAEMQDDVTIAPDWTIEILSPDQSTVRVIDNILYCLKYNTQLGWLIDPKDRSVLVFHPGKEPELLEGEQILPVLEVLKNWQLSVNELFSWLSFSNE
ncbi:Uma2 family endonuclease [Spirulina sp. 06S082]|uniref:Uma2 family endonuclease n=1 Tax=Spirulina sp. 06S082 TaxID=3110248 RepID=UPI002B1F7CD6|nr:Uma2 family endonuclease [Spirulina sp. 06S082]MEA5469246.1 Uma2 family endonuclease [Spirulina sp. 06S082]